MFSENNRKQDSGIFTSVLTIKQNSKWLSPKGNNKKSKRYEQEATQRNRRQI
jgi:hypothetical protein